MLDLDNPFSQHILSASGALDRILEAARRMTRIGRDDRKMLLTTCDTAFAKLRQLGRDHFTHNPGIDPGIDALNRSLSELAMMPGVPEEMTSAEHACPACRTALQRLNQFGRPAPENPTVIYCGNCLDTIMPALQDLRMAFGTEII